MSSPARQYSSFSFVFREIHGHVICLGHAAVHLTFSQDRHETAKQWLKKNHGRLCIADKTEPHSFADILAEFFEGRRQKFPHQTDSPFVEQASGFQRHVWECIAEIPYGETTTYGKLAKAVGSPGAARAVGQACNANPLALIVPCHRVVSSTGLGGFVGGKSIKNALLLLEQGIRLRT